MRVAIVAAWLACSCARAPLAVDGDAGANGVPDLATPDLATRDLSTPPPDFSMLPDLSTAAGDLAGGFCAATPVAGSCVAAFFEAVSACVQPGPCTTSTSRVCYASGAYSIRTPAPSPSASWTEQWIAPDATTVCLTAAHTDTGGISTRTITDTWSANGQTVTRQRTVVDVTVTCGGVTYHFTNSPFPDPSDCPEILDVIEPACSVSATCM